MTDEGQEMTLQQEVNQESEKEVEENASTNEEEPSITAEESRTLFRWNLSLGALHLVTGVAIMVLTDEDATSPVYSFFPDPDSRGISELWKPVSKKQYDAVVGYLSGISLLIAALDHLLVSTVFRRQYEWFLARNRNPFRWIEYSFSASFMHVMIAHLSGVFSIHLLWSIFGFCLVTMIFGNEQEVINCGRSRGESAFPEHVNWRPFYFGWIPHVFGWMVILCFFFQGVSNADPPGFVWAIIFIIFLLDITFPINMWLQQRGKGRWSHYIYGEIMFCVLSLTSKQLLAWLNYGGTASLNSDAE